MLTTILIGLIIVLYAAGAYLMAAFIPAIEMAAAQQDLKLKPSWKVGLVFLWPIAMIVEAVTAGKHNG